MLDIDLVTGNVVFNYGTWEGVYSDAAIHLTEGLHTDPLAFVFLDETIVLNAGDGVTASDAYILPPGVQGFDGTPERPLKGTKGTWEDPAKTGLPVGSQAGALVQSKDLSPSKQVLRLQFKSPLATGTVVEPLRMLADLSIGGKIVKLSKLTRLFANELADQSAAIATFEVKKLVDTEYVVAEPGSFLEFKNQVTVSVTGFVSAGSTRTYDLVATTTTTDGKVQVRTLASSTNAVIVAPFSPYTLVDGQVEFTITAVDVFGKTLFGCTKCNSTVYFVNASSAESLAQTLQDKLTALSGPNPSLEDVLDAILLLGMAADFADTTAPVSRGQMKQAIKDAFAALRKFQNGPQILAVEKALISFFTSIRDAPGKEKNQGIDDLYEDTPTAKALPSLGRTGTVASVASGLDELKAAFLAIGQKDLSDVERRKISEALNALLASLADASCYAAKNTVSKKFDTLAISAAQDTVRATLEAADIEYEQLQWVVVNFGGDIIDSAAIPGSPVGCTRRVCRRIVTDVEIAASPVITCGGIVQLDDMGVPAGKAQVGMTFIQYSPACSYDQVVLRLPNQVDNGPAINGGWQVVLLFDVPAVVLPADKVPLLTTTQLNQVGGSYKVMPPNAPTVSKCVQRDTTALTSTAIVNYPATIPATASDCQPGVGCTCRNNANELGPAGARIAWVSTRSVVNFAPIVRIPALPSPAPTLPPMIDTTQGHAAHDTDDESERLGLALGLGIGIPFILFVCICCLCCWKVYRKRTPGQHPDHIEDPYSAAVVMVKDVPAYVPAYVDAYPAQPYIVGHVPPPTPIYPMVHIA
jgi:hypothetical protein